ncbi:kinesin-like protein KIF25 [Biomphalaria glabrata]|uniref:Kinesin-like protein KIF25 isoform X1 n=2 Tax=Biomphalaria glabrata TaxID=6526 RepID=A0A2C9JN86_BIOGL|nr:kinesin-like protein KIF25 isoform X1 [Biomphalaria glabrata]KAI8758386.1 kinesin-like protein KIF25 [Biomphalaria glabrata]KAI8791899.1 kinesin protein KIF25 [Biomphalaria glabrata]
MPLGLDKTKFLANKARELEVQSRRKDERITLLETENAMLHLKLAQLRGEVTIAKKETSEFYSDLEISDKFKSYVIEKTNKLRKDALNLKQELVKLKTFVEEMPKQFAQYFNRAGTIFQHQTAAFESRSGNITALADEVAQLKNSLKEITERHALEKKRRQELHNTLMELRGNIRVHGRIRPLMEFDVENEDITSLGKPGSRSEVVVHYVDDENICVRTNKHNKVFEYERVYNSTEKQEAIFDEVQPMLTSLLDGYNVSIMAYGQTGSGKTHTMLGSHRNDDYNPSHDPHPDEGVIPRATRELFRLIEEKPVGTHSLEVSVVEVYNNDIKDLLSRDPNAKHDVVTGGDGQLSIPTVTSKPVDNVDSVMTLVQLGLKTRKESATLVHEHSSRSHLIVTLTVTTKAPSFFAKSFAAEPEGNTSISKKGVVGNLQTTNQQPVVRTKLQLVDLAGSECVGMSGVKGAALREASNINKSLSALADVLGALAEHRTHVPYRNSRLTHFLQDSIGGDAKLLILLCVSPAQRYITESLQCLGFGQRARQVQRGPTKRRLPSSAEKVAPENTQSRPNSATR